MNVEARPNRKLTNRKPDLMDWVDQVCTYQAISRLEFGKQIGHTNPSMWAYKGNFPDFISISSILVYSEANNIPEDLKEGFREIISDEISKRAERGKTLTEASPRREITYQKSAECVLYTGVQAGKELGVSRERVRQLRHELGIEHTLFTERDLKRLKKRQEENKENYPNHPRGKRVSKSGTSV